MLSFTIEENALLRYNERQVLGRVKGIDSNYINTAPLKNKIIDGRFLSNQDQEYMAIPGGGVAYYLGLNLKNNFSAINIYIPKPGEINILNPQDAFNTSSVIPIGVFSLQPDFDNKYIIVPLKFAQETINETGKISAIEIQLKKNANAEEAKFAIQKICGKNFNVLTRSEQHDFLNKILSTEKLVSYFVLILILLIATFTITGSLTMLIIEKKRDINILKSLGADTILIKRIFMNEGLLITLLGTVIGLLFGYLVCLIQQTYGIVKLQDAENFIINAYPVGMMISDFLITFAIVAGIGALSSWYAVRNLIR